MAYRRIMGLDVGSVTIGVALSDLMGWTAQGLETIRINESQNDFGFDRLAEIIQAENIEKVVIGLPKNMNNTIGPRAEASLAFGQRLKQRFPQLTIEYQDERLTTVQAERFLIQEGNVRRRKRKQVIDKMAAVMILQNYLDRQTK